MIVILLVIVIFVLVILFRTLAFKPKNIETKDVEDISFDEGEAISNLQKLVRCKTVSYFDHSLEDDAEFENLVSMLPNLYPNVYKNLTLQRFDGRALLFHWKGKETGDPAVFMAHYDVVPVEEDNWSKPAFDALIEDNIMWGRGTLDTKLTFNGTLSAVENLLKQGFTPNKDIYLAYSGGEEVNGPGANNIVSYFAENNITPSFVLDEGGAVVEGVFPGLKQPCGLIGIAEKGYVNMTLSVKSNGGHASAPKPHTPVGVLSKAVTDIESHPFKLNISEPVLKMFDTLGRRSTFLYRMIFANLWCFSWVLDLLGKKSGGNLNALMRTTCAFTQAKGSNAANVIPPSASVTANLRIAPNENIDSMLSYIKQVIKNDDIEISLSDPANPSIISKTDCDGYKWISEAVANTWKGCVVAPYLMVQCSDSKYYGRISDKIYKFSAADLTDEELSSIHGNDEHVRLETIKRAVEFFIRVMKNC